MARLINIWQSAGSSISDTGSNSALSVDAAGTVPSLVVTQNALGGATVAPVRIVASTASQAVLTVQGNTFSTASISLSAANTAFVLPVYNEALAAWGYIACSKGVV